MIQKFQHCLRLQHLISLLSPFQPLDALFVHLLRHLLVPLLLLLRRAFVLDRLNSSLHVVSADRQQRDDDVRLTCLSSSFSAFISVSSFFVSASCASLATLFEYDFWPAVGLKAFLGSCHCFPFFRMPVARALAAVEVPTGSATAAADIFSKSVC